MAKCPAVARSERRAAGGRPDGVVLRAKRKSHGRFSAEFLSRRPLVVEA
jgi:hypothetical protein